MKRGDKTDRLEYGIIIMVLILIIYLSISTDHESANAIPKCPFYALTGYYCPGCGSMRAIKLFARLDPIGAASENLLAVLATPLLVWYIFSKGKYVITGSYDKVIRLRPWITISIGLIFVLFAIIRNLPLGISHFLAPTN